MLVDYPLSCEYVRVLGPASTNYGRAARTKFLEFVHRRVRHRACTVVKSSESRAPSPSWDCFQAELRGKRIRATHTAVYLVPGTILFWRIVVYSLVDITGVHS